MTYNEQKMGSTKMRGNNLSSRNRTTGMISRWLPLRLFLAGALPLILLLAHPFDPAPYPVHEFTHQQHPPPSLVSPSMLQHSDYVGSGSVVGPEDLAYDPVSRVIYTGCEDGWVKRVNLDQSLVEDWVNTGGRPLGIAIAASQLIIADAYKGLLRVSQNKEIQVLTDTAQGLKFKLTDGVDVAKDGTIYFTDASYKYELHDYLLDFFETRPYGRLLSFNPNTNQTNVLLRHLYFPNGVALSPSQDSLIFCETPLKRCKRYWLRGNNKGTAQPFIDNLPGFPDNVHCDGHTNYWIAISSSPHPYLEQANRNQYVRKAIVMMERYMSLLKYTQRNGGIYSVDVQGNPTAHIYDPALRMISSVIKAEDYLYMGSLHYPHIIRFKLSEFQ